MKGFSLSGEFHANVHHEGGSYWAEIVEMPGCFASGDTIEELQEALAEAMSLYQTSQNVSVTIQIVKLERTSVDQSSDSDRSEDESGSYRVAIPA